MDPRFKIVITFIYVVSVFLAKSLASYAFMLLFSILMIALSRIPFKMVISGFRAIMFIIVFTAVLNVLFTKGDTLLFEFKFIHIYKEGIIYALGMVIRLACLLLGSSVLISYTTSPIMLTYGIERLFSPLKKIKVPVHEFAMMMTIALRFIPTLLEETEKIMKAQKARGADFSDGNIFKKIKALVPVLIPLFVSSFRRADELATAMECRCYHGGEGRTTMKVLKAEPLDFVMIFVFIFFGAALVGLNLV